MLATRRCNRHPGGAPRGMDDILKALNALFVLLLHPNQQHKSYRNNKRR